VDMEKIIAGNWKMYGGLSSVRALAQAVAVHVADRARVIVCPPAVWIAEVLDALGGSRVAVGGQDCHAEAEGAFTGDVSARMLKEAGCAYVIVGHSERRAGHHETSAVVQAKAARAMAEGLTPIICVGESLHEREQGLAQDVVARQLAESIPAGADAGHFILAYEPIWAIGTGRIPSPDDIAAMHAHIAGRVGEGTAVLYGGSVKPANASDIMQTPHVHGVLVGGASLVAADFCKIIDAAVRN
jgi:triosephosphate isomerase